MLTKDSSFFIDEKLFVMADDAEKAAVELMRPTMTYWQDAWQRLKKNKLALASLMTIVTLVIAAMIIPELMPYGYEEIIQNAIQKSPSMEHPFGTDNLGRDLFVRCAVGMRISLLIGFISAVIVLAIGVTFGAISGFYGGKVDTIMMRIVDIIYSVPSLLIAILLQVILTEPLNDMFDKYPSLNTLSSVGPGLISIIIVLSTLFWVDMARIVRGQILSLKQQEFILAAKVIGVSNKDIILKHLIPNCTGAIIVTATLKIPEAIFYESFLSFIGLGVSSPMASLGALVNSGLKTIYTFPYVITFPAVLISLIILAFNLLGDGLRDAMDPRLKL